MQWLILEATTDTRHLTLLLHCDNTPAVSWATRMSPKSAVAARLVRALALRHRVSAAAPSIIVHVAGKDNDIADIPSRSFLPGSRWHCPDDKQFLTRFASSFPIPQTACWLLFQPSSRLITSVTSDLLMQPRQMDVWLRLPPIGSVIGSTGAPTANHWGLTHTWNLSPTKPSPDSPPALLDGCGRATTAEAIRSRALECRSRSGPSARPVNWTEGTTLSSVPQTNTSNL